MTDDLAIEPHTLFPLLRRHFPFCRPANSSLPLLAAVLLSAGCEPSNPSGQTQDPSASDKASVPRPRLLSEIEPARFKEADLRVGARPVWIKSSPKGAKRSQSAKPKFDSAKTALLAQCISAEQFGRDGAVELQPGGLLIHPGETLPTRVDFDVKGRFQRVTLHAWIGELPEGALSDKRFGTAQVTVLLDGRKYGKAPVDRHTNQSITLDLSRVATMSIIVDERDKLHFWDWCTIGLE